VWICSDDDTASTESDSKCDSERHSDVYMRMEDDVDAPDGVDLDGDVDMERDSEDDKDEEEEDEKEVEEVDEDEEEDEDEDEDNGKEPQTISQGEMVNTSGDDTDTMVDDQPTLLPEQGQEMHVHTPRPEPPAPAPRPKAPGPAPRPWTPGHRPRPQTPETHTLIRLHFLGHLTPPIPRPAKPTQRKAEAAGNSSDVDVEQQLLDESAGGDNLTNVPLPDVPPPDVPFAKLPRPNVPLPQVPLPDVTLSEECPDGSVGEDWTSRRIAGGVHLG